MTQSDESSPPEDAVSTGATGEMPEASTGSAGETPVEPVETPEEQHFDKLSRDLAERTTDLQRLQAEYVNYKRRVDRDRELVRAQGESAVLLSLLTVLDDIARADEHGELVGGFKAVADSLQAALAKHKLEAYGAKGEVFDPSLHEAVFHAGESAEVDTTTIDTVMLTGYKVGDRVLRAATVGVVDPVSAPAVANDPSSEGQGQPPTEPSDTSSDE